jgi:hypothetical protein
MNIPRGGFQYILLSGAENSAVVSKKKIYEELVENSVQSKQAIIDS